MNRAVIVVLACVSVLPLARVASGQTPMQCGEWLPLVGPDGQGLDGLVRALVVFDDGHGPLLYAGGDFTNAGGQRAPFLARWDGRQWSPVPGLDGAANELDAYVRCLTVWDDGTGPALFVGGGFSTAGGAEANYLARFDGETWTAVAAPTGGGVDGSVSSIHPHDAGDGEALYVAGRFTTAGGAPANGVAKWDGRSWSSLAGDAFIDERIVDLQSYDGDLYASIWYDAFVGSGVLRWDGREWSRTIGDGQAFYTQEVWPLATWDSGGGRKLFAGGRFTIGDAAGSVANTFAWWDGERWEGLGRLPVAYQLGDMLAFDDGTGDALYLSGSFISYPGGGRSAVGRFIDGQTQALQDSPPMFGRTLCVFDDGDGERLYVGGDFRTTTSGQPGYVASWRPRPQCPGDLTGDCQVDLLDYHEFLNRYADGDLRIDYDADGRITHFDWLAYFNLYELGCP